MSSVGYLARWIKILLALVIIWITLAVGAVAEGYLF